LEIEEADTFLINIGSGKDDSIDNMSREIYSKKTILD
jgi:hypothetical protein